MSGKPTVSPTEHLVKLLLDQYFGRLKKIDNYRPRWLQGLEIDRYYPEIKVGIEVQGLQHYRHVKGLQKSREQFFDQLRKDTLKKTLAAQKGVVIVPLSLNDLADPRRVGYSLKRITDLGLKNAEKEKNERAVRVLQKINWRREPDRRILEQLQGIKRGKKWRIKK